MDMDIRRVEIEEGDSDAARMGHNIRIAEIFEEGNFITRAVIAYIDIFKEAFNSGQEEVADKMFEKLIGYGGADEIILGMIETACGWIDADTRFDYENAATAAGQIGELLAKFGDKIDAAVFARQHLMIKKLAETADKHKKKAN